MDYSPGLRGVIAGETAISTVGKEGTSLRYRGYDATELTSNNTYEEVASLILTDSIEDKNFKKSFSKYYIETTKDTKLNELLLEIKEKLHPMDVVRTIVSYKGELTTLRKKSLDNEDKTELSARITAIVCYIIASYHQEACDDLDKQYLVASSLLPNGTSKEKLEALDDMLILYAEHGFNASTFATRVTASTRADLTGAIVSGIATLKGELHGGATINVIYSGGNCYLNGHPLLSKVIASCDMSINWSDGGRIRVGPREHKHGVLKLRSKGVSTGFHVVLSVNIEKYLYGLAEMPSNWNVKALEAQALVGRSYAVYQYLKQNIASEKTSIDAGLSSSRKAYCWCHIGSTASSQYYYGYLKEIAGPNWVQAVNNTSGKVITYDGGYTQSSVIQAFYSSSTGGKTNDNAVGFGSATPWPYLKTVDDPWSIDSRVGNPKSAWSYDFSTYQLSKNILCGDVPCFDSITDIYVSSVAESGAAIEVTMKGFKNGSSKTVKKSGRNIKSQLGFTSHYFKTSSQSDVSNLAVGPVTANNSTTDTGVSTGSSTGDTPQYATSSNGLNYLSKAGLLNKCTQTSSGCQAKTLTREEAAAVVVTVGGLPLDSPNAYSDDDQSIYQKAINSLPYFGLQACFGSPFQFQPNEQVLRDEFACLLIKAINAGTTESLPGSEDKYTDIGASKWASNIKNYLKMRSRVTKD